jgi:hypothetical protein
MMAMGEPEGHSFTVDESSTHWVVVVETKGIYSTSLGESSLVFSRVTEDSQT